MISLKEYLTRCGYSPGNFRRYENRLNNFKRVYADKTVFTRHDVDRYCAQSPKRKQEMNIIENYLRMCLLLREKNREVQNGHTITHAIHEFLQHCELQGFSSSTIKDYKYNLSVFQYFCTHAGIEYMHDIDRNVMCSFKNSLFTSKKHVVKTQRKHLYILRSMITWSMREKIIERNPLRKISMPRKEKHISHNVLTQAEAQRFLRIIDTSTICGFYDRTMFEILYSTGIRINELLSLKCSDIHLDDNLLCVRAGKGEKDRVCILTAIAKRYLSVYLGRVRMRYAKRENEYVFPSGNGNKLDEHYLTRRIRRYLYLAGIEKTISTHAFRRSFATHLLENNMDIRYIQTLMGHKKIDTTMEYITTDMKDLRAVLVNCHPREKTYAEKKIHFSGTRMC